MLTNLEQAAASLGGRIFDLMDATAAGADFDYTKALVDAQRGGVASRAAAEEVPDLDVLLATAKQQMDETRLLRTPTRPEEAEARFRADRLEAINPVIVELARGVDRAVRRARPGRRHPRTRSEDHGGHRGRAAGPQGRRGSPRREAATG